MHARRHLHTCALTRTTPHIRAHASKLRQGHRPGLGSHLPGVLSKRRGHRGTGDAPGRQRPSLVMGLQTQDPRGRETVRDGFLPTGVEGERSPRHPDLGLLAPGPGNQCCPWPLALWHCHGRPGTPPSSPDQAAGEPAPRRARGLQAPDVVPTGAHDTSSGPGGWEPGRGSSHPRGVWLSPPCRARDHVSHARPRGGSYH